MTLEEARQVARMVDAKLRADDPRFDRTVSVHGALEDGTHFFFPDAFALKHDNFTLVFTEHYSYHVFANDEVLVWQWVASEIEELHL